MAPGRGGRGYQNHNNSGQGTGGNERAQHKVGKGNHQRQQQHHHYQASSEHGVQGIDFPVDISFLDAPISERNLHINGNSDPISDGLGGGHHRRGGGGGYQNSFQNNPSNSQNSSSSTNADTNHGSNYGGEKGRNANSNANNANAGPNRTLQSNHQQQTESHLFRIVGEIGRLRAIEQEIRSQGKDLQTLEQTKAEVHKHKAEIASLRQDKLKLVENGKGMKQEIERQNVELINLKEKALEDGKRFMELENALREKDQVQLKADDNFAAAMDDLVQKQRQLEVKDQQMRERNMAIDLKEKQLKEHVGAQEMREMEMQNLVWAREKQIWEMEQVHKNQLEYYKKQVDVLQVELQKQEKLQMISPLLSPESQASSSMAAASHPERASPLSQRESWNANLPLLDPETLHSIVMKTFQTEIHMGDDLTAKGKAKLDMFLLPHSWAHNYQPIYGTIEEFISWDAANATNITLLDPETLHSIVVKTFQTEIHTGDDLTAKGRAKLDTFLLPHSWAHNYQPIYGTIEEFISWDAANATNINTNNAAVVAAMPPGGFHQQVVVTPMPMPAAAKGPATQKGRKKKGKN